MSRFFAFGCSYTDYNWATWADGLCHHYDSQGWETYNYGNSGMGNCHILNAMCAADLKHNFTDSDVICVLWSSWLREDKIWQSGHCGNTIFCKVGSAVNTDVQPYRDYTRVWFSLEDHVMKNVTAIHTANKAFNINYQAHIVHNEEYDLNCAGQDPLMDLFMGMDTANKFYDRDHKEYMLARKRYQSEIPNIDQVDGHPAPGTHLQYLKYKVCPALGIELNKDAQDWMIKQHNKVKLENIKLGKGVRKDQTHNYRQRLEIIKHESISKNTNTKDWRYLWGVDVSEDPMFSGSVEQGVINMLKNAIDGGKLH